MTWKPATTGPFPNPSFTLDSGGQRAAAAAGQWVVELDSAGILIVGYHRAGATRTFGPYRLPPMASMTAWELIDAYEIPPLAAPTPPPGPDEDPLTLELRDEHDWRAVHLGRAVALADPRIAALVDGLARLLSEGLGVSVVLR